MKKYLIVLFCTLLTVAATAQVNHYYVSPVGSNSNDGSQAHPWRNVNWATSHFGLGSGGTTIHVADGTYIESTSACGPIGVAMSFCLAKGGTSTQPVIVQCDNGLNGQAGHPGSPGHCKLRMASNTGNSAMMWIAGANFATFQGFDIGGDSSNPATLVQAGIIIHAKDGNGHDITISQNYIHDISSGANDGNGFGNGCPSEGMVVVNANNTGGAIPVRNKFTGNFLNNGATLSNASCNQYHGMYLQGAQMTVENNIVGNVPGSALKIYPNVCSSVVSNNLVFHAGWWGILVKDGGYGGCAATGYTVGLTSVNNNIAIGNGFNTACSGIMQPASGSGTNSYHNNLLLGNSPNDNINQMSSSASCLSTALAGAVGTLNGSNGATIANTLVDYQADGSGDYHLKAGSVAIAAGSTTCASGGISPCVPAVTFSGITRPQPPSIGFDELGTSATTAPSAPTNLTATVQ